METEGKPQAKQSESGTAKSSEQIPAPAWLAVSRSVALFLGAFSLLNLLAEFRSPGFDANVWWIDLRPCPAPLARGVLALVGMLLVGFAVRPQLHPLLRRMTIAVVMLLFAVALWNSIVYYTLIRQGAIRSDVALPFSLHVAACLAVIVAGLLSKPACSSRPQRDLVIALVTLAVCLIGFPLAQMYCFGKTDYRRKADVIVVFGCRAYADGRASPALEDRVRSGCRLYLDGWANKMIFSGGPGDGDVHETESMRQLALRLGVPDADIILDPNGLSTQATVANTSAMFTERGLKRRLAVSHFYHLPRIKLCYAQAGIDVYTVPADEKNLPNLAYLLTREIVALWVYYLHPLAVRRDQR